MWKGTQCENGQLRSRAVLTGVSCELGVGAVVVGDSLDAREREVRQVSCDGRTQLVPGSGLSLQVSESCQQLRV